MEVLIWEILDSRYKLEKGLCKIKTYSSDVYAVIGDSFEIKKEIRCLGLQGEKIMSYWHIKMTEDSHQYYFNQQYDKFSSF